MKPRHLFKTIFFFILSVAFCTISNHSFAYQDIDDENAIIRVRYSVIDKTSKSFRSFFGARSGEINFELIELENLDTKESLLGIEISIKSKETEQVSSSIAFSSIGSMWGISSGATYRNLQRSGYIFLNDEDLTEIIVFLNGILVAVGQAQHGFVLYSISIRQYFEFGMLYDPDSMGENKWNLIFTADGVTYAMDYIDGIAVLRKLDSFRNYIIENKLYFI